jgi:hypothetical protein
VACDWLSWNGAGSSGGACVELSISWQGSSIKHVRKNPLLSTPPPPSSLPHTHFLTSKAMGGYMAWSDPSVTRWIYGTSPAVYSLTHSLTPKPMPYEYHIFGTCSILVLFIMLGNVISVLYLSMFCGIWVECRRLVLNTWNWADQQLDTRLAPILLGIQEFPRSVKLCHSLEARRPNKTEVIAPSVLSSVDRVNWILKIYQQHWAAFSLVNDSFYVVS